MRRSWGGAAQRVPPFFSAVGLRRRLWAMSGPMTSCHRAASFDPKLQPRLAARPGLSGWAPAGVMADDLAGVAERRAS